MIPIIIICVLISALLLPHWWVNRVMKKYSIIIEELPGNGGELANHLIERYKLDQITVAETDSGDHYDPTSYQINLTEKNYHDKSLTAVVIATHEFGHALQHYSGYRPFLIRLRLAKLINFLEKIASVMLLASPFLLILTKHAPISLITFLSGFIIMGLPVIFHLVTLPVELDASFKRALPILVEGQYLPESATPIAKKILRAAAATYVSASLAGLLNFYHWIKILRR